MKKNDVMNKNKIQVEFCLVVFTTLGSYELYIQESKLTDGIFIDRVLKPLAYSIFTNGSVYKVKCYKLGKNNQLLFETN